MKQRTGFWCAFCVVVLLATGCNSDVAPRRHDKKTPSPEFGGRRALKLQRRLQELANQRPTEVPTTSLTLEAQVAELVNAVFQKHAEKLDQIKLSLTNFKEAFGTLDECCGFDQEVLSYFDLEGVLATDILDQVLKGELPLHKVKEIVMSQIRWWNGDVSDTFGDLQNVLVFLNMEDASSHIEDIQAGLKEMFDIPDSYFQKFARTMDEIIAKPEIVLSLFEYDVEHHKLDADVRPIVTQLAATLRQMRRSVQAGEQSLLKIVDIVTKVLQKAAVREVWETLQAGKLPQVDRIQALAFDLAFEGMMLNLERMKMNAELDAIFREGNKLQAAINNYFMTAASVSAMDPVSAMEEALTRLQENVHEMLETGATGTILPEISDVFDGYVNTVKTTTRVTKTRLMPAFAQLEQLWSGAAFANMQRLKQWFQQQANSPYGLHLGKARRKFFSHFHQIKKVTVKESFVSDDEEAYSLPAGLRGIVTEIDDDGDSLINFCEVGNGKDKWVFSKNFRKLEIDQVCETPWVLQYKTDVQDLRDQIVNLLLESVADEWMDIAQAIATYFLGVSSTESRARCWNLTESHAGFAGCWEAWTPDYPHCIGYEAVGYTCVGMRCAGKDVRGDPDVCAKLVPGGVLNTKQARCIVGERVEGSLPPAAEG